MSTHRLQVSLTVVCIHLSCMVALFGGIDGPLYSFLLENLPDVLTYVPAIVITGGPLHMYTSKFKQYLVLVCLSVCAIIRLTKPFLSPYVYLVHVTLALFLLGFVTKNAQRQIQEYPTIHTYDWAASGHNSVYRFPE